MIAERSHRFETWIAPMRARAEPWRVLAGVGLAGGLWLVAVAVGLGIAVRAGASPGRGLIVVYLVTFGVLIAGLGAVMRRLHRLPGARLLGAGGRLDASQLAAGAAVVAAIVGALLVPMLLLDPPERQQSVLSWAIWLPAVLPALLVQAAAEELLFRGYLQGMLAARFASRLVWWVLPAVLFGLLHWNPAMGGNAWAVAGVAALMGLALGDVAARSGGLSLPIGLHFANNVFALLVMSAPSELSGLALWLSPLDPGDPAAVRAALAGNAFLIVAVWGGYLLVVRWRRRR